MAKGEELKKCVPYLQAHFQRGRLETVAHLRQETGAWMEIDRAGVSGVGGRGRVGFKVLVLIPPSPEAACDSQGGSEISAEAWLLGRQHLLPQGLPSLSEGLVQPSSF